MSKYLQNVSILLLGLLMAASIGFSYLTGNQHTYLVDGLRTIDPTLLQHDWFATQTTHYHGNFAYLLWLIHQIMPLSLGTVLVNAALVVLSIWGLLRLLQYCEVEKPLVVLTMVVGLMIFTGSSAVGQSYIYSDYLQPSSIASVFWCLAFIWLVRQQYLVAGLLLLVGGIFHTNFLLLGLATFGLVNLALGPGEFIKRCLLSMGPACLYLLYLLPGLLGMSGSEFGEQSRYIYQHIRSPHHYVPMTYLADFIKFAGMSLLGLAFCLEPANRQERFKTLTWLFLSMWFIVTIATLLTTVVFVPFVSQLFPWRFAPFANLLATIMAVITLARYLERGELPSVKATVLYGLGLALVLTYYLSNADVSLVVALPLCLLLVAVTFFLMGMESVKSLLIKTPLWAAAIGVLLIASVLRVPGGYQKSNLLQTPPQSKQALFDWAKNETKVDAQFLIPPGFGDFRLNAQRAVMVDWKSPPIMPDEVIKWYERIGDVTGVKDIKSLKQANQAYSEMDRERLARLKRQYNIDYALFYKAKDSLHPAFGKVAFENEKYWVIAL